MNPQVIKEWIDCLGGRRFHLTLACLVLEPALLVHKYIDQGTFERLFIASVVFYIAGNVYQKHQEIKNGLGKASQ